MDKKEIFILWTSDNLHTAEQMVFLYAINALKNKWWDEITIIIWGASTLVANRNPKIQSLIKEALSVGVKISACSVCADRLLAIEKLQELGVELKLWGEPLTKLIQENKKLITV